MWTGTSRRCWEAAPRQSPEVVEITNDIGQTGRLNKVSLRLSSVGFLGENHPHSKSRIICRCSSKTANVEKEKG